MYVTPIKRVSKTPYVYMYFQNYRGVKLQIHFFNSN